MKNKVNDVNVLENRYLYSMWNGTLKKYCGEITTGTLTDPCVAIFYANDHSKKVLCSSEPELMYNGIVWIDKDDDELAREIFIDYENQQIEGLKKKIANHERKIQALSGGISNESERVF